ncbi:MAG: PEGA domain-containing protein [Methanomicrobiales archaeon]|nr:PEGA domain-containing protein [Methanomicrobiales archaeon]
MFLKKPSYTIPLAVFLALLAIILPAGAFTVAMYGSNSGFDPALHPDTVTVVRSIPGSAGTDLDGSVNQFTKESVDVMIISGEDTFSPSTAAKLETAVAEGKILIITYPSNRAFDASLPGSNGGSSTGEQSMVISNPAGAESKEIFAGMQAPFTLTGPAPDKEQVVPKSGAVTLLNFGTDTTGMPALLYWKYGKGYVIEWTTGPAPSYMSGETADSILYRLITRLLPSPATPAATPATAAPVQTTAAATPATLVTTIQPVATTQLPSVTPTPVSGLQGGDVSVYSSPLGASILIDGKYYGTTPANLTGVPQGSHIIRLAMSGYYDYEGTIYVIPGESSHAFGTLQPTNQISSPSTQQVPVIVPVVTAEPVITATAEKGLLENSSVVVAIIGVITASIAAGATIFTHTRQQPPKKE